jgi:hypothetical protein
LKENVMIIKLENLIGSQFGKLSALLAGEDNLLPPPPGFKYWVNRGDEESGPMHSVKRIKFAHLVEANEKKSRFTVTLKVLEEAEATNYDVKSSAGDARTTVPISSAPLLRLIQSTGLYPAEIQGLKDEDAFLKPTMELVVLGRAGSGDMPVHRPDDNWVKLMRGLSEFNYGKVSIVVQTDQSTGYEGYPGCTLWLVPGDENGQNLSEEDSRDKERRRSRPDDIIRSHGNGGNLGISTNYDDLKELHEAIGRALKNMEGRREKK